MNRKQLYRIVVGALKQTISVHGPIESKNICSATKRIVGTVIKFHTQTCPLTKEKNEQIKHKNPSLR